MTALGLATLEWVDPETQDRRTYILHADERSVIGRADDCAVCIHERHVSRHQAQIVYHDGAFYIADAESTGPFFVNDRRVVGEMPLKSGDVIRLYVVTLTFRLAPNRRK
jgi:pSer/pThr/pTyr-binding forkhead associated (FHA) protein